MKFLSALLIAFVFLAVVVFASEEVGRDKIVEQVDDVVDDATNKLHMTRRRAKSIAADTVASEEMDQDVESEDKEDKKKDEVATTVVGRMSTAWGNFRTKAILRYCDFVNGNWKLPAVNARNVRNAAAVVGVAAAAAYYYANKEAVDQALIDYYGSGVEAYEAYKVNGTLPSFLNASNWEFELYRHMN